MSPRLLLGVEGLLGLPELEPGAEWRVRWLAAPPPWVLWLVLLPLLVAFCVACYRLSAAPQAARGRRIGLACCRAAALTLLLAMLADPILAVERVVERRSVVAVLLDESLSMSFVDRYPEADDRRRLAEAAGWIGVGAPLSGEAEARLGTTSRFDLLRAVVRHHQADVLDRLAADHIVKVYGFGSRVRRDPDLASPTAAPTGAHTRLGDAIVEVLDDLKGQAVAALLVCTDGRGNAGDVNARDAARAAAGRGSGVPIFPVAVGSPELPRDLRLAGVEAADLVLADEQWELEVTLSHHGFAGDEARVAVHRDTPDGPEMAAESTTLGPAGTPQRVRLRTRRFEAPGEYTCVVIVPPHPDDTAPENNQRTVHVRVVDQKLKVLYVDGRPRFEYRHLSDAMCRDRNLRVHVLLADADPDYPQRHSLEGGLRPLGIFPRTEQELFEYDVVILGDLAVDTTRGLFTEPDKQMAMLERFVEELGGGLVFLASTEANPHRFRGTPLEPLLPVYLAEGTGTGFTDEEIMPLRTSLGRGHALLQLEPDPARAARNEDLWAANGRARLRGFLWTSPVGREKPHAEVYLRHPTARPTGSEDGRPILASMWYGRGRTVFVGTDEVWRWRELQGDRYFYRFYSNLIRFVGHNRLLGAARRFQLSLDRTSVTLGERIALRARVLDEGFQPSREPQVKVMHQAGDGAPVEVVLEKVPQREGQYEGSLVADRLGSHRLWFAVRDGAGESQAALMGFDVVVPERELADPALDRVTLQALFDESRTGTVVKRDRFFQLWEWSTIPPLVPAGNILVTGVEAVYRLWDSWLAFALLVGLLCVEWIVRKMSRLP